MAIAGPLTVEQASVLLDRLGVVSYGADLRAGAIDWKDQAGRVVARGRGKVILSYSPVDRSWLKGWANQQLVTAGVPVVPDSGDAPSARDVDEAEAVIEAAQTAERDGAMFVYRCELGQGALFFAVDEVTLGVADEPLSDDERARRVEAVTAFVETMLRRLAALAERDPPVAKKALAQLQRAVEQQREFVVAGLPVASRFEMLLARMKRWSAELPEQAPDVARGLRAEARLWQPG